MTAVAKTKPSDAPTNRWVQLLLGLIAMMAVSSPQYVWTLFTGPLNQKLGTTLAEIQITFSLLIVLQTFFSPFQAYLVDRFGPKLLISVGAIMSGGSWVLASYADSLTALYITYGIIGGFGTGIIYVGASSGESVGSGPWLIQPWFGFCIVVEAVGMWATLLRCPHVHSLRAYWPPVLRSLRKRKNFRQVESKERC